MLLTTEIRNQLGRLGKTKLMLVIQEVECLAKKTNVHDVHHFLKVATYQILSQGDGNAPGLPEKIKEFTNQLLEILQRFSEGEEFDEYVAAIRRIAQGGAPYALENVTDFWIKTTPPEPIEFPTTNLYDDLLNANLPSSAQYYKHQECEKLLKVVYKVDYGEVATIERFFLSGGKIVTSPSQYYTTFQCEFNTTQEVTGSTFPYSVPLRDTTVRLASSARMSGDTHRPRQIPLQNSGLWLRAKRKAMIIECEQSLRENSFMDKVFSELVIPNKYCDDVVTIVAQMLEHGFHKGSVKIGPAPAALIRRLRVPDKYVEQVTDLITLYASTVHTPEEI